MALTIVVVVWRQKAFTKFDSLERRILRRGQLGDCGGRPCRRVGFIVGDVVARSTVKRGNEVADFVVILSGIGDVRDEALSVSKVDKSVAVIGAVGGAKT